MIIQCPNCQTKYNIAAKAIGSAGRKVQCANCQQAWQASAEPEPEKFRPTLVSSTDSAAAPEQGSQKNTSGASDRLFDKSSEDDLDIVFEKTAADEAEETASNFTDMVAKVRADVEASADQAKEQSLDASLQNASTRKSSMRGLKRIVGTVSARTNRYLRIGSIITLIALVACGAFLRNDIVKIFPELSGVYELIGINVNIIGLEFDDVETLQSLRDGADVMLITAKIRNVSDSIVTVPPILVNVLDAQGQPVFQWQARALASVLERGEVALFETQLNSAPLGAKSVRLNFSQDN